ncbi:MAG: hypothetical protein GC160_20235 [Acidobacteria bacterium]|nr:hypothetical protein [Acidobacteriota bacterium]
MSNPLRLLDRPRLVFAVLAAVFLAGAIGTALTEKPWCDEGWFASPALNLAREGYMGTDLLETANTHLTGIRERTYWIFPLYPVILAGWFKLVGYSLFTMRLVSVLAGGAILWALFTIVRRLKLDWRVSAVAIGLLIVDYQFLRRASEGRMDALCAAFGYASIAVYLSWRETRLRQAILASHALCAAAMITHPNGGLYFLPLALAQLYFDFRRLRWTDLLAAGAPYVVGFGLWSIYIFQDPQDFLTQLGGNAKNRGVFWTDPLRAIADELRVRYMEQIGGIDPAAGLLKNLKAIVLATIVIGVGGFLSTKRFRSEPATRYLAMATLVQAVALAILDGYRMHFYAVHIVPWYFLLTALFVVEAWRGGRAPARAAIAVWLAAYTVIQAGGAAYPIYRDNMHNGFEPAVAFLRPYAEQGKMIMGSAELGFELGFKSNIVDDWSLGCDSGKTPDVIVEELGYVKNQQSWLSPGDRCYAHVQKLLHHSGYRVAFEQGDFQIYTRDEP